VITHYDCEPPQPVTRCFTQCCARLAEDERPDLVAGGDADDADVGLQVAVGGGLHDVVGLLEDLWAGQGGENRVTKGGRVLLLER
jgi:hypothetical protein